MNQIKIGEFIASLRKEQGQTQKQLAERIGVSDKTVSKWECGNGLPEMSSIPLLCDALNINMNELLSGERLEQETYSVKAEENMMNLMKETEMHKKRSKTSFVTLLICLCSVVAIMILAVSVGIGSSAVLVFLDLPTLLMIVIPSLLILAAAGLFKQFFGAFALLGKRGMYEDEQWRKAKNALELGAKTFFTVGAVETIATIILLLGFYAKGMSREQFLANIAISVLGILYGAVIYLLILPIRYKVKSEIEEK